MKKKRSSILATIIITLLSSMILASTSLAKTAPTKIAGISLGSDVHSYPEIIQTNFMKEVVVTDYHGFRKGVISYGVCYYLNQILKIDMKYEDKSTRFYQKLLKRFKKRYGEPNSWHGDSFGVMYVWKWHFIDEEKNRITLKLQHNTKDSNETIGNMVKLSYPDKINEERECFMDMCEQEKENFDPKRREALKKSDWSYLIPQ